MKKKKIGLAHLYVTQMLAMIPVPEKVWVFGDQISGTFKINSILHAGQRTRALTLGLPEDPGQLAGMVSTNKHLSNNTKSVMACRNSRMVKSRETK